MLGPLACWEWGVLLVFSCLQFSLVAFHVLVLTYLQWQYQSSSYPPISRRNSTRSIVCRRFTSTAFRAHDHGNDGQRTCPLQQITGKIVSSRSQGHLE